MDEKNPGEKIIGTCPHYNCGGNVIEARTQKFDPSHGPPIIGPGYKNQLRTSVSYHCDKCLSMFIGPPKS